MKQALLSFRFSLFIVTIYWFHRWPLFASMIRHFFVCEASRQRMVVDHKHIHHHTLGEECIHKAGHSHKLDNTISRVTIHVDATNKAHHVPDNVECGKEVEKAAVLLDPASVAAVRDGPAVGVKEHDLETVGVDNLASRAPPSEESDMDHQMAEQAQVGHIVIPEKHTLHVEGEVRVAILVHIPLIIVGFLVHYGVTIDWCLIYILSFFCPVLRLLKDQNLHLVRWHDVIYIIDY